jgi:hypothetical protein
MSSATKLNHLRRRVGRGIGDKLEALILRSEVRRYTRYLRRGAGDAQSLKHFNLHRSLIIIGLRISARNSAQLKLGEALVILGSS